MTSLLKGLNSAVAVAVAVAATTQYPSSSPAHPNLHSAYSCYHIHQTCLPSNYSSTHVPTPAPASAIVLAAGIAVAVAVAVVEDYEYARAKADLPSLSSAEVVSTDCDSAMTSAAIP